MRFAFSNIAWSPHDSPVALWILKAHGIEGIEVAPTKVWPGWVGATFSAATEYRKQLEGEGFTVPAVQAVLFERPAARLFDLAGERELVSHLSHVAQIASALRAKAVVLGAPKHRDRGTLSMDEAMDAAVAVFRDLGQIYFDHGTCLCVEPNPRKYGCNFIVNSREGEQLVRRVAHPGVGLHLDAAAMHLEGESLSERCGAVRDILRHFHVSEPELAGFARPVVPHRTNLAVLRDNAYRGWCSVEMRETEAGLERNAPWGLLDEFAR